VNEKLEDVLNEKYGEKSILPILQDIEKQVNKSILKFGHNSFTFYIQQLKFKLDIKLEHKFDDDLIHNPYRGSFNIFDYIKGLREIHVYVKSHEKDKIDKTELFSVIYHELTHVFQVILFTDNYDTSKYSMSKNPAINNVTDKTLNPMPMMDEFTECVYYSLHHELDASINMIYSYLYRHRLRDKSLTDFDPVLNNYEPHQHLLTLKAFDYKEFMDKFKNKDELLYYTNLINKEFKYPEITIKELNSYYKKWNNRFRRVSKKYLRGVECIKKRMAHMNEEFSHYPPIVFRCHDYSYKDNINKNVQEYFSELFKEVQNDARKI